MNDSELTTAVRESVAGVHMDVPAEQIAARSRAIRARRRIPAVTGGLALAAGAALAVPALLPSSPPAGRPGSAQLTAWTVTKQADGNVRVALHELRDPAGLQRKLRADGVPASVRFASKPNPACHGYPGSGTQQQRRHLLGSVASVPAGGRTSWSSTPRRCRRAGA